MSGTNWEKSKALTPLKHDLIKGLFRCSRKFFLTGGSALGVFYLEHRWSHDLDIFVTDDTEWMALPGDFVKMASDLGASIKQLSLSPTFLRYEITRGSERELVDFVRESVPQIWPDKPCIDGVRVDSPEEITVNKWCSLLGRAELKDLVDLFFLSRICNIWELFEKAHLKEGGLEPSVLSWIVSQINIEEIPDSLIASLSVSELQGFRESLLDFLNAKSFPEQQS